MNTRDQYSLELVLSPLFVGISANGDITTRNQELVGVIKSEDKTEHLEQRVITVRMLGDTAVANGTYVLHHKASSGPTDEKGVFLAVDVKAVEPLPKPVTLAAIRGEAKLKDMALVKYSRLSVQPVTAAEWKNVCHMGGKKG